MPSGVGIIGIGYEGFRPVLPDISTREMMFIASSRAYEDAGIDPRKDISSFISCDEDFWEGWSITDEMVPDQIGGARRPVCTVSGDGLLGIAHAVMQIESGVGDVVAVEAHSKLGDVLSKKEVEDMGLEPSYVRPVADTDALAALEMSYFMNAYGISRGMLNRIVSVEKNRGLKNPRASYASKIREDEVESSEAIVEPLLCLDKAGYADGAITVVLASDKWIKRNKVDAIYVSIGWSSALPFYEASSSDASYVRDAFRVCCKNAGIKEDISSFDILEIDDTYSYKLAQHLASLVGDKKETIRLIEEMPEFLNPSSGSLALGNMVEASSLARVVEAVLQLRGQAAALQLKRANSCLIASWRGHPSATGSALILSR